MDGLMMDYPLTLEKIARRANRVFGHKEIVSVSPDGSRFRYTYADFYGRMVRLMNVLRNLGVERGTRVATFSWNNHRHLELYHAIPNVGAVLHTLNVRLSAEQLTFIVNHAEDAIIFADASVLSALEPLADQLSTVRYYVVMEDEAQMPETSLSPVLNYEQLMREADAREDFPRLEENEAAGLCYTSGTTGNPKGTLYSHRGLYLHTLTAGMSDMMGLSERDTLLPVVPMFHANAWGSCFLAPIVGAKLVLPGPDLSPQALLPLIHEEGITQAMGVPTVWLGLLQHLRASGQTMGPMQKMVVGGSAAPRALIESYKKEYDVEIVHAWGMTEMSPLGTLNQFAPKVAHLPDDERFELLARAGLPAPLVEMKIVDDFGNEQPWDGEAMGELVVRGPSIARSYYNNPEAADRFTDDGWFRTGDVATIDANGLMQITDRTKDLIKSGGEWISSVEMENALMAHPDVAEAAVVARTDAKWGERPVAFVVPAGNGALDAAAVIAHLGGTFAKWQLPAAEDVRVIDAIPRTSVGKFNKRALRTQLDAAS